MQITDLREIPSNTLFETDICIVGAGPAGITLATELAGSSLQVLVLESGNMSLETKFTDSLNEVENIGAPRQMNQRLVRNRIVGGTSYTWSGRCTPLDALDYEPRLWIPHSGWPISKAEIEPYLRRAARHLGTSETEYGEELLRVFHLPARFDSHHEEELRTLFWQFSRISALNDDFVRFGPRFRRLKAANLRLLTNATVTELIPSDKGTHVREVEIASERQNRCRIRSHFVVLCAGGIENPRILLASRRGDIRGIGNRYDLVGRFLMDHPRGTLGTFPVEAHAAIQAEFGLFRHPNSGAVFMRGLSFTRRTQERYGFVNCSAWTTQHVALDDAWRALRTIARNNGSDRLALSRTVLRHADQIVYGLWCKYIRRTSLPRRMGRLDLDGMFEQVPDPASRITLSERTDAFGVPLARIDWRVGEAERRTAIHLGHAINESLARAGKPQAILADWVRERRPEDAIFHDPAHPIGTTRMSFNEYTGVVDPSGRVHGVDNLFISGSSTFPTGGHANPTLMIIALAVRLADYLRQNSRRLADSVVHTVQTEPIVVAENGALIRNKAPVSVTFPG